jgi:hypothetical protein
MSRAGSGDRDVPIHAGSHQVSRQADIFLYRRNRAAKSTGADAGCDPVRAGHHRKVLNSIAPPAITWRLT